MADKPVMANNKGFSLTELLVTVGILSIMATIATVTYRKYDIGVEKRNLRQAGRHFALAVGNCISASGGWKITRPPTKTDSDGNKTLDFSQPEVPIYPCEADDADDDTTDSDDCGADLACELKKKLNFVCPASATCHTESSAGSPAWEYYCLDIQKTVQGTKLRVMAAVPYKNPSNYRVLCKENDSITGSLHFSHCKRAGKKLLEPANGFEVCKWGSPPETQTPQNPSS